MEAGFGRSFADVRVHTDGAAGRSAASVDAHAYTSGRELVFAHGRYDPATPAGRHLLAHELAHVVQQRRSPSPGPIQRFTAYSSAEQTGGKSRGWTHPGGKDMRVSDDGQMAVDDRGWGAGTEQAGMDDTGPDHDVERRPRRAGLARPPPREARRRHDLRLGARGRRGVDADRDRAVPAERQRAVQPHLGLRRTPAGRSSAAGRRRP